MARHVTLIKRLLTEIQRQVFMSLKMQGLAMMQVPVKGLRNRFC